MGDNEHWLLWTSDRKHGGFKVLGIFNKYGDALKFYYKTHDEDEQYYRIPHVERWENDNRIQ